jgi:pyruvate dehydrogenase E1 component
VFYYITVMNENYTHPGLPEGAEEGILKGMYQFKPGARQKAKSGANQPLTVQLLGSGTILREVIAAGALLEQDWEVSADIWSCTSFTELRREGLDCERWNLLHPDETPRESWVEKKLKDSSGPIVASSDYMKTFAEQIRPFIPSGRTYRVLGADGFGRSDTRERLRDFFEVDRHWVTVAALKALADQGDIKATVVAAAIRKYGIDPNKSNPVTV